MAQFNVFALLTNSYVPAVVHLANCSIIPLQGQGVIDACALLEHFSTNVLGQTPAPPELRAKESMRIAEAGASTMIEIPGVSATTHVEAIQSTEAQLLVLIEVIAFRQIQRGTLAGFLSIRTDVTPPELYVQARPPYGLLRKIINIPIGGTEADEIEPLLSAVQLYPRLRLYLSLFTEAISQTSTLLTDTYRDIQIVKLWSLLETMAYRESGTNKAKVKALFHRHNCSTYPNYKGNTGKDLIDIAYEWRNLVAHAGGRSAATTTRDINFCARHANDFEDVREELTQSIRFLIRLGAGSA